MNYVLDQENLRFILQVESKTHYRNIHIDGKKATAVSNEAFHNLLYRRNNIIYAFDFRREKEKQFKSPDKSKFKKKKNLASSHKFK